MKKLLALLLAVVMVLGIVACTPATPTEPSGTTPKPTTPTPTEPTPTEPSGPVYDNVYYTDPETGVVYVGTLDLVAGVAGGGEVGYDIYAGIAGKDYTDPAYYTYSDYTSAMTDLKWSTHTWETSDDSAILDYIISPYYTFYLNSTGDGWSIACEMAAELPQDVTAEYVGQYGIEEGDELQAWKIVLRQDMTWEDGTPINADSFVYSAKELLDPLMKNRRADSLYAGDFQIYGAKDYFYQGQSVETYMSSLSLTIADLTKGDDGNYYYEGNLVSIPVTAVNTNYFGSNSLAQYVNAYGTQYFDVTDWDKLVAATGDDGYAPLNDDTYAWLKTLITGNPAWNEDESYLPNYFSCSVAYAEYAWEDVGFIKTGDYELVMIATTAIENPNYYVPYNLSSTYLVYQPLWESCKTWWDANNNKVEAGSPDAVLVTTNYCTNKETTMSYGPYKMSYFELDKQYNLVRNDAWYGYSDGNHSGFYQTDEIKVVVIADHATAMMAFESGSIMGVGLQESDMEKYGSHKNLLYTPQSYTTKITFNIDKTSLESHGTGSQVLANRTLRNALSIAIDRNDYCTSLTAGHLPGFGLLNSLYVYDPFTGASYRDTDGAKDALVQLFGLTYGEDGDFEDLDEAYEAITGYDPALAKELMIKAAEECVAEGLWDGTSTIGLEFCVYSSDEIYIKIFNFLNDAVKAATVGTPFEGKLELKMKEDADYYNTMYSGNTDIIFSTWGGAAYSPYTMLDQCYCDDAWGGGNQMEYGFETDKYMVQMVIDGHVFTNNLQTWAAWAGGKEVTITSDDGELTLGRFGSYDAATRSNAFSKLEYAFLASYATTSLYYRNSVSVFSEKMNYATTTYVDLVGYGGIAFVTYNYTDAEWDALNG